MSSWWLFAQTRETASEVSPRCKEVSYSYKQTPARVRVLRLLGAAAATGLRFLPLLGVFTDCCCAALLRDGATPSHVGQSPVDLPIPHRLAAMLTTPQNAQFVLPKHREGGKNFELRSEGLVRYTCPRHLSV